jgi:hypothetical protein
VLVAGTRYILDCVQRYVPEFVGSSRAWTVLARPVVACRRNVPECATSAGGSLRCCAEDGRRPPAATEQTIRA